MATEAALARAELDFAWDRGAVQIASRMASRARRMRIKSAARERGVA